MQASPDAMRALIALIALSSAARAEPVRVGPDPCPAPADAAPYEPDPSVAADDLNPWREAVLDSGPVLHDVKLGSGRETRTFKRFAIDPETGEAIGFAPVETPCPPNPKAQ